MKYILSYDRAEVIYTVEFGGNVKTFTMPYSTALWGWIGSMLEPGDTLEWVRD